jgi:hypothetical protein
MSSFEITEGVPQLITPTDTLGVATGETTALISWTDTNSVPNEESFEVQIDIVDTFDSAPFIQNAGQDATSLPITALTTGQDYYVRVRAVGNGSSTTTSNWSNPYGPFTPAIQWTAEDNFVSPDWDDETIPNRWLKLSTHDLWPDGDDWCHQEAGGCDCKFTNSGHGMRRNNIFTLGLNYECELVVSSVTTAGLQVWCDTLIETITTPGAHTITINAAAAVEFRILRNNAASRFELSSFRYRQI